MPASYNRYQSRLFNLILQQSIRLTDRTAQTLRNLQVATVWGIQALLYPVYVAVQATRNVLNQSATTQTPQFASTDETPIPSSDAPIQIVLHDIERGELDVIQDSVFPEFTEETLEASHFPTTLPNKFPKLTAVAQWLKSGLNRMGAIVGNRENASASIAVSPKNSLTQNCPDKLSIRGIASLTTDGKLVLVSDDNQILDLLNSRQQHKLEQRIFIEIGNYWMARQPAGEKLPTEKKPNRLLAWMETSPLAISLNLFQEATLASVPKNDRAAPRTTPNSPDFSSKSSAAFPPSSIASVNPVQNATVDRGNSIARSTQASFAETKQFLVEKARRVRFPQLSDPWQTSSENSPDHRSSTISSEKRHFSSRETARKALPTAPQLPKFPYHQIGNIVKSVSDSWEKNLTRVTDRFAKIADPWLSPMEQPETIDSENPIEWHLRSNIQSSLGDRPLKQLPAAQSLEKSVNHLQTWAKSSRNWLAEWGIPGLEPMAEVAIESASPGWETPEQDLSPTQIEAMDLLPNPFVWESAVATLPNAPQSNWIETEATSVEYIKHPLERVLEWLDRIAFWIEERAVKLWQRLQQFWHLYLHPDK